MRILFMGTPEFAVPSLRRLIEDGHDICGAVTQPDKPVGRKQTLTAPPVKQLALQCEIPVFQPKNLCEGNGLDIVERTCPELIVVVAYGKILPPDMLNYPKHGCINVHGSLLPEYRGAAPIQRAVIDGKRVTGITTMLMDKGLDTGDMLLKREVVIDENETAEELFSRLADEGAALLSDTLSELQCGTLVPVPQDGNLATYAKMISRADSPVDWCESARNVHCKVRGLYGWPSAEATCMYGKVKLHRTLLSKQTGGTPGEIISIKPLVVSCGDGNSIEIVELQLQGGKRLPAGDFMRGHPLQTGDFFR